MAGLSLPWLLKARAQAAAAARRDTAVIWLWLNGGPTHIETFDPKMNAPVEFRSVTGEVKTRLPGVTFGGNFEQMAACADKLAIVRSFVVPTSSHNLGCWWVNTGYSQRSDRPSLGSISSRVRGPNHPKTGIPTYVRLGRVGFGDDANRMAGPAWLGKAYAPFEPEGPARENMQLTTEVNRLADRRDLLGKLDVMRRQVDASGMMEGIDGFNQQAIDLILGNAADAFDVQKESPKTVERYGEGLAESLLTARRLCEAGCGFVTVGFQGWDMHSSVERGMNRVGPQVDRAVSALIEDLHARGLDKKILFVVTGEYGRTPRINQKAGRDHWGPLSTLAMAGGGLAMGQVIGESSAKAETPASSPINPQDLMATVFHVLGIAPDVHFEDPAGRPVPMLADGRPISDLV